jgi:hypothetical protein
MRLSQCMYGILAFAVILWIEASLAPAHEADQAGPRTHTELITTIDKVQSGLLFLKPVAGLQFRAVSLKKAERMGLHEAKPGDKVTLVVDEGNIVVDIHKKGAAPAGHHVVSGKLAYADPFWEVIELSTPQGTEHFAVDSLAGSKLSILEAGRRVRVELDEDNVVVDIHPTH